MIKAKEITQNQLIRSIKATKDKKSSIRHGFILGAGASLSSGIPLGSFFADKWYKEIKEDISAESLTKWKDNIKNFSENNLAENYTKIFEKRFEANYEEGYQELQGYMDKAKPSIGYSFLAQLLDETSNKFVITTNFDTMTEDALFEFQKSKPLVLGHELLSKYINPTSQSRPTIIKIHRDFLLNPYNKDSETKKLDEQWQIALEPVLKENSMIVIGYGGNDSSLMNYLKNIQMEDRKPIYWCFLGDKNNLSDKIKELLTKHDYIVPIKGFDKFMLIINDELKFDNLIDQDDINKSRIVLKALEYAKEHKKQLEELTKKGLDDNEQKAVKKLLPSWWAYQLRVDHIDNINERNKIYLEGLNNFPNSYELMGNYATFLYSAKKDYDDAEKYYKKALDLEPDSDINCGAYANFLRATKKDYDKAEKYYKKALELEPNNVLNNKNYATFLMDIKKDYEDVEKYYKKALELEANDPDFIGNYANFLVARKKDYEDAEKYYKKALDLEPNHSNNNINYAMFLEDTKKDYDKAEKYYKKALELEPNNTAYIENYTNFLKNF